MHLIAINIFIFICLQTGVNQDVFFKKLSDAAIELTHQKVKYDPTYRVIKYPNGDVPSNTGVCSDVVIRAYRKMGIDLQQEVHLDMSKHFNKYPTKWGLKKPDTNIDHRRVYNLMTFFDRKGASKPISKRAEDYIPGDIVAWMLPGNLTHIGIVISEKQNGTPLIVHNIGAGQVKENCLFKYTIIGHYRYKKG